MAERCRCSASFSPRVGPVGLPGMSGFIRFLAFLGLFRAGPPLAAVGRWA